MDTASSMDSHMLDTLSLSEDMGFTVKTVCPSKHFDLHRGGSPCSSRTSSIDVHPSRTSVSELRRLLDSLKQQQFDTVSHCLPAYSNNHANGTVATARSPHEGIENQIEVLQDEVDRIGGQLQQLFAKLGDGASNSPSRSPHASGKPDHTHPRKSPSTPTSAHHNNEQASPNECFLGGKRHSSPQPRSPSAIVAVYPSTHKNCSDDTQANPRKVSNLEAQAQHLQQQLLKCKVSQRSASQTEQRLMGVIEELRKERRKLEDRLMEPHADLARMFQKTRDSLETKVDRLKVEANQLEAEISTLHMECAKAVSAYSTVDGLRQALASEHGKAAQQRAAKLKLENQVTQIRRDLKMYHENQEKTVMAMTTHNEELASKLAAAQKEADALQRQLKNTLAEEHSTKMQLQNREALLEEMRSAAESLRTANNRLQDDIRDRERELAKSLETFAAARREAQDKITELTSALNTERQSALAAQKQHQEAITQLEGRLHEARGAKNEVAERLQAEQIQAALARQAMEHAQEQLQHIVSQRKDAEKAFQAKVEIQIAELKHQHEVNMSSARKQYEALQMQYEGSVNASRKLWDQHHSLQKERDRLFAQLQGMKAEMMDLQADRDSLAASLREIKDETRRRVADMLSDKETSLKELEACHLEGIKQLKTKMDNAKKDHTNTIEELEQAKSDIERNLEDAMRQLERSQNTAATLRQQLQDATVQKEQAEQELAVEKQYTEELNGIIIAIKNGNLISN